MKYTRRNNIRNILLNVARGTLPSFGEDYDKHWNYLNFKGKKILDLGADYGSTASYFLWQGAKQVIAVERNEEFAEALRKTFEKNPESYR
ncbi:MAG: hypothetical protein QXI91_03285 [Candidatus Bathyarchaeia archaeon]